ncbi:MAG: hypothetical protein AAF682_30115 [Planctomycetota bacterium]
MTQPSFFAAAGLCTAASLALLPLAHASVPQGRGQQSISSASSIAWSAPSSAPRGFLTSLATEIELLAVNGSQSNPGRLVRVDQELFTGTLIGDSGAPQLSGLAETLDGRLWATTGTSGGNSELLELSPTTGQILGQTPVQRPDGTLLRISDLAVQPGTGVLYGCGGPSPLVSGQVYTIDVETGVATSIGDTGLSNDGGLAFHPDGTLYLASAALSNRFLVTLDPATGTVLSQITYGALGLALDGLAVRPSDGALIGTGNGSSVSELFQLDPISGELTSLGSTGLGKASDLAYRVVESVVLEAFAVNGFIGDKDGRLVSLDPCKLEGATVGGKITHALSGVALTPDGRLWASTGGYPNDQSELLELAPATGEVLSETPIRDSEGAILRISDLAVQPGTGTVFGCGGVWPDLGQVHTIDVETGVATSIGDTGQSGDGGLAFHPDGTLYLLSSKPSKRFLATIDPATGATLSKITYTVWGSGAEGLDGLAVRPSDGALIATGNGFSDPKLYLIDPVTGDLTSLGSTGAGHPCDLTFRIVTPTQNAFAVNGFIGDKDGRLVSLDPYGLEGQTVGGKITHALSGVALTPDGRLWASTGGWPKDQSELLELAPATGEVLSQKPIQDPDGGLLRISDLAVQPGTGTVFGCGGVWPDLGQVHTIDVETGVATSIGDTGQSGDGGLAFHPDGTLYLISAKPSKRFLATIDPATGATLSKINYKVAGSGAEGIDGLAVRPSDGALIGTGNGFSDPKLYLIDPVTGDLTSLGSTGAGHPCDLTFLACPTVVASTAVRLGTPPNPNAYLPGSQDPLLGTVWDPRVDHASFLPAAVSDFAGFSATPSNTPLPFGVLLCALPLVGTQIVPAGEPFSFPIPTGCALAGVTLCSQAGSVAADGTIQVTNALDLVLGSL